MPLPRGTYGMPQVSVVIPTRNRADKLLRALASVSAQTAKDFEVIVVDDGDGAQEVAEKFAELPVHVLKTKGAAGAAAARNMGVKDAKGEYVAFLDDDDVWVPHKLERQVAAFEKAPHAVFSFSSVKNIYDDREEITRVPQGEMHYLERALTRFSGFLTSTLLIKKEAFRAAGGFDESLPSHQEPDLVIRLSKVSTGTGIDEPLTEMSMSRSYEHIGSDLSRRIAGRKALLAKHADLFNVRPGILGKHYFRIGLWNRDCGNKKEARNYFRKAFLLSWNPRYVAHYLLSFISPTP